MPSQCDIRYNSALTYGGELQMSAPLVGIVMGSESDWEVMKHAARQLKDFGIPFEARALSAHRTPDLLIEWIDKMTAGGAQCFIAGAGGAAHLAGVVAAKTTLPVLAVPMPSKYLQGLNSLLSMVQMPAGIPVATVAIGKPGAINAALLAASMLSAKHSAVRDAWLKFRRDQTQKAVDNQNPAG